MLCSRCGQREAATVVRTIHVPPKGQGSGPAPDVLGPPPADAAVCEACGAEVLWAGDVEAARLLEQYVGTAPAAERPLAEAELRRLAESIVHRQAGWGWPPPPAELQAFVDRHRGGPAGQAPPSGV